MLPRLRIVLTLRRVINYYYYYYYYAISWPFGQVEQSNSGRGRMSRDYLNRDYSILTSHFHN